MDKKFFAFEEVVLPGTKKEHITVHSFQDKTERDKWAARPVKQQFLSGAKPKRRIANEREAIQAMRMFGFMSVVRHSSIDTAKDINAACVKDSSKND